MLACLRYLLLAGLAASAIVGPLASPALAAQSDCRQAALEKLKTLAPDSFSIYATITDKKFFLSWITCDDLQLGLSTAVHESVHHLTEDHDAFPLLDGHELPRPHEVSKFFPPSAIAGKFDRKDMFAFTYLRPGQASSASDFMYLLDEMNAYTHDLNAAISLNKLRPADQFVAHRDGLAALMSFVAVYAETAEESHPATWAGLQKMLPEISELWTEAETILAASCRIPDFGSQDQASIRHFCGQKAQASLTKIIGRPPVCPVQCLTSAKSAARQWPRASE
jgi:hypothetical protein